MRNVIVVSSFHVGQCRASRASVLAVIGHMSFACEIAGARQSYSMEDNPLFRIHLIPDPLDYDVGFRSEIMSITGHSEERGELGPVEANFPMTTP